VVDGYAILDSINPKATEREFTPDHVSHDFYSKVVKLAQEKIEKVGRRLGIK
jgi:hypothetical protein